MTPLSKLRNAADAAEAHFYDTLRALYPGRTEWDWHRAEPGSIFANDRRLINAWDARRSALHAYYALRDGPRGFIGRYEPAPLATLPPPPY